MHGVEPEELGNLSSLQELEISQCYKLESLPDSLGRLSCWKRLELCECSSLKSLPSNLGRRSAYQPATGQGGGRNDEGPAIQTTAAGENTAKLTGVVIYCKFLDDSRMRRLDWTRYRSGLGVVYKRKWPDSGNAAVQRILWSTRALISMFVGIFILRKEFAGLHTTQK